MFPATAALVDRLRERGHHVTIETAATVDCHGLTADLISMSPKLANSTPIDGPFAARHEARRFRPLVVRALMAMPWQLKFVIRTQPAESLAADIREVEDMLAAFGVRERDRDRVLLMPECTRAEELSAAYAALVPACTSRGFRLGQRLHIAIFGHVAGT